MNIINENQNDVNFYLETESSQINNENVNKTVTDALNAKIEAETDEYCRAARHERNSKRKDYRNGSRKLALDLPVFGKLNLTVQDTRKGGIKSKTYQELVKLVKLIRNQIIVLLYALGIAVRDIPYVLSMMGFKRIEKSRIDEIIVNLADKVMQAFYSRDFSNTYCPIIYVDSLYDPIRYSGRYQKMAIMVVYGINMQGIPVFLGLLTAPGESSKPYIELFEDLKSRGLGCPKIVISDGHRGIRKAVNTCFPGCLRQLCYVHHIRNALRKLPNTASRAERSRFGRDMSAIFDAPTKEEAIQRAGEFIRKYKKLYPEATIIFQKGYMECLSFYDLPEIDRNFIRSSNLIERQNSEFRRRLDKVHGFPNMDACKRLILISRLKRPWFKKTLIPKKQLKKAVKARNRILKKLEKRLEAVTESFLKSFREEMASLFYSKTLFGIKLVYEPNIFYENNGGLMVGCLFAYGITDKGKRFPFALIPVIHSQKTAVESLLGIIKQFSLTRVGYICHNLTESAAVEILRAEIPQLQEIYSRDDLKEEIQDWLPEKFWEESSKLLSALFKEKDQGQFKKKLANYIDTFEEVCPDAVRVLLKHTDSYSQLLGLFRGNLNLSGCASIETPRKIVQSAVKKTENGQNIFIKSPDLIGYFNRIYESLLLECKNEVFKQNYINRQTISTILGNFN